MAVTSRLWADLHDDGSDTDLDSTASTFSPDAVRSSGRSLEESLAFSESYSEEVPWRPNIEAPEFIPTQTMTCLLVGVCEVGNPSRSRLPRAQKPLPLQISNSGKEKQDSSGLSGAALAELRSEDLKKALPSKATRSASAWSSASTATSLGSSETSSTAGAQSEVPEATEEDWKRRAQTRSKDIAKGKMLPTYRLYIEHIPKLEREADEPLTPDPLDRSISKRLWKYRLREWHKALESCSAAGDGVARVPFVEERHSAADDQEHR